MTWTSSTSLKAPPAFDSKKGVRFLPLADSAGDTHCELRALPDIEKVNQRNGGQHLLPLRNLNTLELPAATGHDRYGLLWVRLRMAARYWRRERINDQEVWVTEALGD